MPPSAQSQECFQNVDMSFQEGVEHNLFFREITNGLWLGGSPEGDELHRQEAELLGGEGSAGFNATASPFAGAGIRTVPQDQGSQQSILAEYPPQASFGPRSSFIEPSESTRVAAQSGHGNIRYPYSSESRNASLSSGISMPAPKRVRLAPTSSDTSWSPFEPSPPRQELLQRLFRTVLNDSELKWFYFWRLVHPHRLPDSKEVDGLSKLAKVRHEDVFRWFQVHSGMTSDSSGISYRSTDSLCCQDGSSESGHCATIGLATSTSQQSQGSRIYQCTKKCGKSFETKGAWKRHEELERPQKVWFCYLCKERTKCFKRKDKLTSDHFRKEHQGIAPDARRIEGACHVNSGPFSLPCGFCPVAPNSWDAWIAHVARHFEGKNDEDLWNASEWEDFWVEKDNLSQAGHSGDVGDESSRDSQDRSGPRPVTRRSMARLQEDVAQTAQSTQPGERSFNQMKVVIQGMGHDLPDPILEHMADGSSGINFTEKLLADSARQHGTPNDDLSLSQIGAIPRISINGTTSTSHAGRTLASPLSHYRRRRHRDVSNR